MIRARRSGVVARQAGNAASAALTALSTSAASANDTDRITSPVAGFVTSPYRGLPAGVFRPLIQSGTVARDVDEGGLTTAGVAIGLLLYSRHEANPIGL